MHVYKFWIKRTHGSRYELITIAAKDSWDAVDKLPTCVTWDITS